MFKNESSLFIEPYIGIKKEKRGTRSISVLLVDKKNQCVFFERSFDGKGQYEDS
jgi:uncharacterized protein with NRDE domain